MRENIFLLFLLLAELVETNASSLMIQEEKNEETRERVLIRSKRRWVLTTIDLEEESPGPFPMKITELFNDQQGLNSLRFSIKGQGVTEEPIGALDINDKTGEVFMNKPIDRELYPLLHVKFDVYDINTHQLLDKTLSFDVAIHDINDNPPVFKPRVLRANVPENIKEGLLPFTLQASDRDEVGNDNSRISMRILSQEPPLPQFTLKSIGNINDSQVVQVFFTGCFDYDKARNYKMLVEARDHGTPSLSSTTTVFIDITDSNTHLPVFTAPKYNAEVMENERNKEILRISVQDQDAPNTPASRAVFSILKGNEEGNYKIETDPVTNEGVLTVIKAKDYEITTLTELEIGVKNEEPLFVCVDGKPVSPIPETLTKGNTVKVAVKVIDMNDPPVFQKQIYKVFKVEEEEPGDVLYTPVVTDEDSDPAKIRYELVEDPAKWMSIDPKTGKVSSAKKMDRESPFVQNNTYTVVILAIDDGEPPATGTGTMIVQLADKNDNVPHLISNTSVMCGNKANSVTVRAQDPDGFPFAGPFTFTLGEDDQKLTGLWKLDPNTGYETSLISLTNLPNGMYSVPLTVADQQGLLSHEMFQVMVCDCGKGDVCPPRTPQSSHLHGAAIGILLGALLLMALFICCCFSCKCREEKKQCLQFEGIQTLIPYNEEGGRSVCKVNLLENFLFSPPDSNFASKTEQMEFQSSSNICGSVRRGTIQHTQTLNGFRDTANLKNMFGLSTFGTRGSRNSAYDTVWSGVSRSFGFNMEELLDQKLSKMSMEQQDPEYQPRDYSTEGTKISTYSLDKLSFNSTGDNLDLQSLGPKFNTLGVICQEELIKKNIKL